MPLSSGLRRQPVERAGNGPGLPFTGQNVALFALVGAAALVTGTVVTVAARKPRPSAARQDVDTGAD